MSVPATRSEAPLPSHQNDPIQPVQRGPGARRAGEAARGLGAGVALLPEALRLLRARRELWLPALLPLAISFVLLAAAFFGIASHFDALYALASDWAPQLEASTWIAWLWIGPARLLLWLAGALLFVVLCALIAVAAVLVASVLSSPVLDVLSERVERAAAGRVAAAETGLAGVFRDGLRSLLNDLRRLSFFAGVWVLVWGVALLVPGGALVAPPLLVAFSVVFLPLEYSGYALDRRGVAFRDRRRWVRAHLTTMLGFGGSAFALGMVPGLNVLALPVLVVAGTLLALRYPPSALSPMPASDARTATSP